jgi:hypothetical protein
VAICWRAGSDNGRSELVILFANLSSSGCVALMSAQSIG